MTTSDEYRQLHGEFTRLLQEGDRKDIELIEERALADDLAKVIATNFNVNRGTFIWEEDTPVPDVVTVMARYRAARGPVRKPDRKMSNEEVDQAARYREARGR